MNDDNMYSYLAACNNCHATQEYSIPKGTTTRDFMVGKVCTHCGLKMVASDYPREERGGVRMVAESDDKHKGLGL